jgi:hypothetical protein
MADVDSDFIIADHPFKSNCGGSGLLVRTEGGGAEVVKVSYAADRLSIWKSGDLVKGRAREEEGCDDIRLREVLAMIRE